mgnify:FL=1
MAKQVRVQDKVNIECDTINHMQDDIVGLLKILGLVDCARDISPHEVMVNEIIPAVKDLTRKSKMEHSFSEIVVYLRKSDFTLTCECGTITTYGSSMNEHFEEGVSLECRKCKKEYYPIVNVTIGNSKSQMKRIKEQTVINHRHEIPLDVACEHLGCRAMSKRVCDNYCYGHKKYLERIEKTRKVDEFTGKEDK